MATGSFYHFQGDPNDEAAWQAFIAANSESTSDERTRGSSQSAVLRALYELALVLVIIVALGGTVLWQQKTQQIAALEDQVQTLEQELADAATARANEALESGAPQAGTAHRPPVHRIVDAQFFRFVVETEMATAAATVAPELEAAYGALRADLGLPRAPIAEPINILLVNDGADYAAAPYAELGVILIDRASYALPLQEAPDEFAQAIYDDLYSQMAHRALHQALTSRGINPTWNVVITHLYSTLEQSQLTVGIDLLPNHKVQQRKVAQSLSLNTVLLSHEPTDWIYPDVMLAHDAADSLVEYILVTYGRESVPHLLDAMGQSADWNGVAPAIFGIPTEQFEAQWHAYLYEHYPTDAEPSQSD